MIGCYVHQYELRRSDRAAYGEHLIERLAVQLKELGIPRTDVRELRRYRRFFLAYPQIRESLTPELAKALPSLPSVGQIRDSLSPELAQSLPPLPSAEEIRDPPSPESRSCRARTIQGDGFHVSDVFVRKIAAAVALRACA